MICVSFSLISFIPRNTAKQIVRTPVCSRCVWWNIKHFFSFQLVVTDSATALRRLMRCS